MKNIILLVSSLLLLVACNSKSKSKDNSAEELTQESSFNYSAQSALEYLTSDELEGRDTGSKGIDAAATYIETAFENFGLEPYFETYRDSFQIESLDGFNVVGVIKSTTADKSLKPLVLGAHYDHIGIIKPEENDSIANGANDNASGTVAVLELANYLSSQDLERDVILALFSAEEKGLRGAKHLAEKMKSLEVEPYLVFNIEMLGVPMQDKPYQAYVTGYEMSNIADVFNSYYDSEFLGFLPQAKEMNLFKRSDNYPFYEVFQIPSHTICTFDFTNYDYYHHVNDEFEELDIEAYLNLLDELKPGVLQLINSEANAVKLK